MALPLRRSRDAFLLTGVLLCAFLLPISAAPPPRKGKITRDAADILSQMNETAKHLKTVTANLDYTTVTVLVNDKSTETGQLYFRNGKNPEILIEFQIPDQKTILFKKNKAEYYLPKINQIQEFNLEQKSGLVQEFLLLGFGSEISELRKSYNIKYLKEEELEGNSTAVLELTPHKQSVAQQLTKVQIWVSEDSWLPAQQQCFEPGGNYLIARYSSVKVNRPIDPSTFELHPAKGAKRVKMN